MTIQEAERFLMAVTFEDATMDPDNAEAVKEDIGWAKAKKAFGIDAVSIRNAAKAFRTI